MNFTKIFATAVVAASVLFNSASAIAYEKPDIQSYISRDFQKIQFPKMPSVGDIGGIKGIRHKSQGTWMEFEVTAYSKEEFPDSHTASGVWPTPYYTCASDDLPFGTIVVIDGHEWIVQDRFGAGHFGRLDLFFPTDHECFSWGRRWVEAEVFLPY